METLWMLFSRCSFVCGAAKCRAMIIIGWKQGRVDMCIYMHLWICATVQAGFRGLFWGIAWSASICAFSSSRCSLIFLWSKCAVHHSQPTHLPARQCLGAIPMHIYALAQWHVTVMFIGGNQTFVSNTQEEDLTFQIPRRMATAAKEKAASLATPTLGLFSPRETMTSPGDFSFLSNISSQH